MLDQTKIYLFIFGALTIAGYILGFPGDTGESILRDVRIIQRELPVDLLEFFVLTPLPGSQDHKELHDRGVALEADLNLYDSAHVTAPHARMSSGEWQHAYEQAWETYCDIAHVETVMRRAREWGYSVRKVRWMMFTFCFASPHQTSPAISEVSRLRFSTVIRRRFTSISPSFSTLVAMICATTLSSSGPRTATTSSRESSDI